MRGTQAKRLRAQARKLCNPNATGYRVYMVRPQRHPKVIEEIVRCIPTGFRATYQKLKREFKR